MLAMVGWPEFRGNCHKFSRVKYISQASSHRLSTCCQVQLSSYRVYQYLMILRHSSGFRPRAFAVSLIQLASYSLMIQLQSQQSLAQQQDKTAVCKWRYKHSLTSLECYEYVSKTKQLQDTFIVGHAVTNVILTVILLPLACFRPFSVCGLFTTF